MTAGVAICSLGLQLASHAQNVTSTVESAVTPARVISSGRQDATPDLLAMAAAERPVDSASAAAVSTSSATSAATGTPATVAVPTHQDAVIKELAEMKARIAQLEAELKAGSDAAVAEHDANELRKAEGAATGGGSGSSATPAAQTSMAPPAATAPAAPAPPEIGAQTTKKGEPFEEQQWPRRRQPHEYEVLHTRVPRGRKLHSRL